MKRIRSVLALLAAGCLLYVQSQAQTGLQHPRRIAIFGSSVANGTGDEFNKEGYTGMLRQLMAARGWEVLNQSRGGDTTVTLAERFSPQGAPAPGVRYLTPVNPGYAVIALSLNNEGVFEARTMEGKDAIFKQYADGIQGMVARARQNNIVPIVGLAYTRGVFTPVEYDYVRRINLLQNFWNVPSINFLGAVDDGKGKWAPGFSFDEKHPNASGHRELLYAIVPTLFEAIEKGKPIPSKLPAPAGFARLTGGTAPLTFEPPDTMHPFSISLMVRAETDGTIAAISGSSLAARSEMKKFAVPGRSVDFQSTVLSADGPFTATIGIQNGKWIYKAAGAADVTSSINADSDWHHVVLSHYAARGETLFFVDGKLAGAVAERLQPSLFVFGGPGSVGGNAAPKQMDIKDIFLFRAGLNADEVTVLGQGKVLQASLEIYSPLNDSQFRPGSAAENRAQSLTGLKVGSDRISHVEQDPR